MSLRIRAVAGKHARVQCWFDTVIKETLRQAQQSQQEPQPSFARPITRTKIRRFRRAGSPCTLASDARTTLSYSTHHSNHWRYFSSHEPKNDTAERQSTVVDPTTVTVPSSSLSDPPIWTWVDRVVPVSLQPYAKLARMDKPIGSLLLLWPCYWSLSVAAGPGQLPDLSLLTLFGVGAVVMRGAGCTINDMWDANLDKNVARTKTRPLAAGDLNMTQATAFLAAQLSVGLGVLLSLPHTWYCVQWGCASLPLVALYPATKRFLSHPQVILGLAFNWGAILGWAAVHGSVDWSIVAPLYGSGVTWTVVYDTLYAHQDKKDDAKLSLQSTALTWGTNDDVQRRILHGLAAATLGQWLVVGHAAALAWVPYSLGVTLAYSHLVWQIQTAEFDNPHNLAQRFRSNNVTGGILFAALTTGTYFAG